MKYLAVMVAALAVVLLGAMLLTGCESADNAAARRARAEQQAANAQRDAELARAEVERARGEADVERQRAVAEAEASLAATRQMERDAAHQRVVEMLPYVLVIVGGLLLAGLGGLMFWDLRRQPRPVAADPGLLYLERLRLEDRARERDLWRAIALLARRGVGAGQEERVVIVYDEGQ